MTKYQSLVASGIGIMILILFCTLLAFEGITNNYALADNNWYVGKGALNDFYLTYNIQDHDTKQGREFQMTIYFKNFNATGHYWDAPTFVVDRGNVINGTFHLSDLDLTALGSSIIPKEMLPYKGAYTSTLQWLSAFVPKPGQSLTAPYWGKIASIGGQAISPSGNQKITTPAGTFDTTTISWHKGRDNIIWINKNLPYPVKAETYADVTTGIPPIQYKFQLLKLGKGEPLIPKSQMQIPKPPVIQQTITGRYYVELLWEPELIQAEKETKFGLVFMNNDKAIINNVAYDFKITSVNGTILKQMMNQKSVDGTGVQNFNSTIPGQIVVEVDINAVAGIPLGIFVESAKFPLIVSQ